MFGRSKKDKNARRHSIETAQITFQNYRRGTTLSNFSDEQREKTERQKSKVLRVRRRQISVILLILIIVCVLGGLLRSEFDGSVGEIVTNATVTTNDTNRYKEIIDEYFSRRPFERFNFMRNDNDLSRHIIEHAPEIVAARIERRELKIEFRKPLAVLTFAGKTKYVDATGTVFDKNYFSDPAIRIIDNNPANDSDTMTSKRLLTFVGRVVSQLSDKDVTVERVEIPVGALRFVEFRLAERDYPIKAQIDRDPSSQSADIVAIINHLDRNNIVPTEYVDCRVAGKAYWK